MQRENLMLRRERLLTAGMMVLSFGLLAGVVPGGLRVARAQGGDDSRIEEDVHKALDNKRFQNVSASVHDGSVVLTGSVGLYADKEDADKHAHHVKGVKGIDNEIEVAGTPVEDGTLRDKLAQKLAYDRVGYGTTAFNDITV